MDVVVGLGSNLGDRQATLASAVGEIARLGPIQAVSSLYATAPLGPPQPDYLNAAVRGAFRLSPAELLTSLLRIEQGLGRVRGERWGPRAIDLDILWIDGLAVADDVLVVPHPGLLDRRFALVPLLDVAPDARHPDGGIRLADYLAAAPEAGIRKIAGPDWAPP